MRLLIQQHRLVYGSCSSDQHFACGFLQTASHDNSPCRPANGSRYQAHRGLAPPSRCALPGTHKKKRSFQSERPLLFFTPPRGGNILFLFTFSQQQTAQSHQNHRRRLRNTDRFNGDLIHIDRAALWNKKDKFFGGIGAFKDK